MNNVCYDLMLRLSGAIGGTFAGTTSGYNYYIFQEPATPDNTITFYNYNGEDLSCLTGEFAERCNVQIRVRNNDYQTARSIQETIRGALNVTTFTTAASATYFVNREGVATDLRVDENNRAIVVQNYNIVRSI
tara:strand:- start:432 stop:830 length:399 start_codon:yes stop_codon:yes gene_type:complete